MTQTISFASPLRQQGQTTLAIALAIFAVQSGLKVKLVVDDEEMLEDVFATCGSESIDSVSVVVDTNDLRDIESGADLVIRDTRFSNSTDANATLLVLRGPSYPAVRRATVQAGKFAWTNVVLNTEVGRSLGVRDVESIFGVRAIVAPIDPHVARAIDAGLLIARIQVTLQQAASAILNICS
jgi:hypothetical protein